MKESKAKSKTTKPQEKRSGKDRRLKNDRRQPSYPEYSGPERRSETERRRGEDRRNLYLHAVTFPHSF